jgi:hypothetical protein
MSFHKAGSPNLFNMERRNYISLLMSQLRGEGYIAISQVSPRHTEVDSRNYGKLLFGKRCI